MISAFFSFISLSSDLSISVESISPSKVGIVAPSTTIIKVTKDDCLSRNNTSFPLEEGVEQPVTTAKATSVGYTNVVQQLIQRIVLPTLVPNKSQLNGNY